MINDLTLEQQMRPNGVEIGPTPQLVDHVILDDFPAAIDYSPHRLPNTSNNVVHLFLYRLGSTDFVVKIYGDRSLTAPPDAEITDLETKIRNYETATKQQDEDNKILSSYRASLNGSAQQQDRLLRAVTRSGEEVDDLSITDESVRAQLMLLGKYHLIKEIQQEADNAVTAIQETPEQLNGVNNSTGLSRLLRKFLG